MRLYVHTRAIPRRKDYRFLGASPGGAWWRDFDGLTTFEEPTLLVEAVEGGWRLYATGIPSVRNDSTGAQIRFSLAGDGGYDEKDADSVFRLVQSWLEQAAGGDDELGRRLDAEFSEEVVLPAYERPAPGAEYHDDVRAHLERVLGGLPPAVEASEASVDGSWLAGLVSPAGRAALSASCRDVLAGRSDLAAVLNVAAREDLEELTADRQVGALILDGPPVPEPIVASDDEPLAEVVPPGKAESQGLTTWMRQTLATRNGKLTVGGATLLMIVVILLVWIGPP